jgi:hypothetical protein
MRITDIIRGVLDIVDAGNAPAQTEPDAIAALAIAPEPEPQDDALLAVIQQLAGLPVEPEPEYANEPCEVVAPVGASFPGGDDVHSRKNPADIRTNAPSMYPNFQAKQ